jgi:hypothetical protein
VVHFWLAEFLAKHRPDAREEALRQARTALELPSRKGPPEDRIKRLIQELQSGSQPVP